MTGAVAYRFISAAQTSTDVRTALASGKAFSADRWLAEAVSRLILAPAGDIPATVIAEPASTGWREYDCLLATAFAFALIQRGQPAEPWMLRPPALEREWMWDGGYDDASEAFRDFIRANTPPIFLAKNLLLRERDLIAP